MNPKLTNKGKNLLLRALNGDPLLFTKVQLGNGASQSAEEATALNNPQVTLEITDADIGDGYITLVTTFNNNSIATGFRITEAGFFVQDPDDETQDILYALGNEPSSSADYVPAASNRIVELQFDSMIFIGDAENVTAAIASSLIYTTKEEFEEHTEDTSNPHGVTKTQVGLGLIENALPADQTVTFTPSALLTVLSSGETLGVSLGKTATAVAKLKSHVENEVNPHGVSPEMIGAAPSAHTHDAGSINTGILPVNRGGTGVSTVDALKALIGETGVQVGYYTGNYQEYDSGIHDPDTWRTIITFPSTPKFVLSWRTDYNSYGNPFTDLYCLLARDKDTIPDSDTYNVSRLTGGNSYQVRCVRRAWYGPLGEVSYMWAGPNKKNVRYIYFYKL